MVFIQKQACVFILLLGFFLVVSFVCSVAFAATYGSDKYGNCPYGQGCTPGPASNQTSTNSNSTPSAPACGDTKPGVTAPWLYGAIPQSRSSILLYFTENSDPVDKYVLEYGTSVGNYQYASQNIGGHGTRTYLVSSLSPNTIYYFRVRASNGCATGEWSNEISAKTKNMLSTNSLIITSTELTSDGTSEMDTTSSLNQDGYQVNIQVVNTDKKPIEGVTVTVHPDPRSGKTGKDGKVSFDKVGAGQHQVLVAYNEYEGDQTIYLTGDAKTFNLYIVVEEKQVFFSKEALIVIVVLGIFVICLIFLLLRKRGK